MSFSGCNTCGYLPSALAGLLGDIPVPANFVPPSIPSLPSGLALGTQMTGAEIDALTMVAQAWATATGQDPTGAGSTAFEDFLGEHYPAIIKAAYRSEGVEWPIKSGPVTVAPEAVIASFDAPTTGGPWALNENGEWFTVTKPAPGSATAKLDGRLIYLPPLHPSVRKTIPEFNNQLATRFIFEDQKARAVNRNLLKGDFYKTFFDSAPRGSGPAGIGAGMAFDGTPEDYDCEGGNLYPDLQPSNPIAQELTQWWHGGWDGTYGSGNKDLNWFRAYTDPSNGYRRYKMWSKPELDEYARRWHLAQNGYVCTGSEIQKMQAEGANLQAARSRAQTEGSYSPHYAWPINPLAQCTPTSSSRRRKLIKKLAVVGAIVAGAIFLGPAIAAKVKAVAAKIGGILKGKGIGGAVAGKLGNKTEPESPTQSQGGISNEQLQTLLTNTVGAVNAVRTIDAIKSGEIPPPPVNMTGSNFTDWATSIGMSALQSEQQQRLTAIEQANYEAQMRAEIQRLQSAASVYPTTQPMYSLPIVSPQIQATQMNEEITRKAEANNMQMLMIGGAALVGILLLTQQRRG